MQLKNVIRKCILFLLDRCYLEVMCRCFFRQWRGKDGSKGTSSEMLFSVSQVREECILYVGWEMNEYDSVNNYINRIIHLFMANAFENVIKDQSDMEPWAVWHIVSSLPFSLILCFYNVSPPWIVSLLVPTHWLYLEICVLLLSSSSYAIALCTFRAWCSIWGLVSWRSV